MPTSNRYMQIELPGSEAFETIEASKARQGFSELLDATQRGLRFVITRNGRPAAAVVPLRDLERLHGSDKGIDQNMMEGRDASPSEDVPPVPFETFDESSEQTASEARAGEGASSEDDILDMPLRAALTSMMDCIINEKFVDVAASTSATRLMTMCEQEGHPSGSLPPINVLTEEIRSSMFQAVEDPSLMSRIANVMISRPLTK